MKKFRYSLLILVLLACQKQVIEPTVYSIDPDLNVYLQTFLDEAQKRGKTFPKDNLILSFGKTVKEACGECTIASNGQKTIKINKDDGFCWKSTADQNREALVLHELGHCLLDRQHRTDVLANDVPLSIMYTIATGLYEPCVYQLGDPKECDKRYRRAYYIDELFDPKTPAPSW